MTRDMSGTSVSEVFLYATAWQLAVCLADWPIPCTVEVSHTAVFIQQVDSWRGGKKCQQPAGEPEPGEDDSCHTAHARALCL